MMSVVRTLHAPVLSSFNVRQTVFYTVGPSLGTGRLGLTGKLGAGSVVVCFAAVKEDLQ